MIRSNHIIHSSLTAHHSPLTIHCLPLTVHHLPLTINHSPFTIHYSPFTTHHSPLTTHHSPNKKIFHSPNHLALTLENKSPKICQDKKNLYFFTPKQWEASL
ncbi:MAG: hypothetical protein JSS94_02010 [Bacteroidetes bacterium]|nr:hypothetical protein [Bacteroidota bacterium]